MLILLDQDQTRCDSVNSNSKIVPTMIINIIYAMVHFGPYENVNNFNYVVVNNTDD